MFGFLLEEVRDMCFEFMRLKGRRKNEGEDIQLSS